MLYTGLYIEIYLFWSILCFHFCCISLTFCPPDYPVLSFDGRKKVVFSNVSWMGGKNEFLGIAYLVIGSLCIIMSIVMLIVYAKFKFPDEEWVPSHGQWLAVRFIYPINNYSCFFNFFLPKRMMKAPYIAHTKGSIELETTLKWHVSHEDINPLRCRRSLVSFSVIWLDTGVFPFTPQ